MMNRLEEAQVARQYSKAWLDYAQSNNLMDSTCQDVTALETLFEKLPQLSEYLRNPSIALAEKNTLLKDQVLSKVSEGTSRLIQLVAENGRVGLLQQVIHGFQSLYDQSRGHLVAEVTVPCKVPDATLQRLKSNLEQHLSLNHIELSVKEDSSILAGAVVKIGDQVLDGSYLSKLQQLKQFSTTR
jgi:F-type H+-transporting ATPase subunit delta